VLKRVDKLPDMRRPQEPRAPYPYREEEVAYDNKPGRSRLAGTLTLPKSGGPFPAVLLITGSGQQDRNESLLGHKPFLVLADYLTRRGVAVLRVDDRGVGGSTGEVFRATSEDFAGDALAGVAYLKGRKDIDGRRIGLIGHSEGGIIAPMCAIRSKDVAFIVLMAGPGVRGDRILRAQSALILKAMGGTPQQVKQNSANLDRIMKIVMTEKDDKKAQFKLREAAAKDPDLAQGTSPQAGGHNKQALEAQVKMMLSPWFRYFLSYDPAPTLRKVRCPVLAVNGEKDLQVPARENLQAVAAALKAGGNANVTTKELRGLNHLFQKCATGAPSEYATIPETINTGALKTIGDWVVSTARR